jgi:hypothetical protein
MPTNHGLRPDDGQCVYNARNEAYSPTNTNRSKVRKANLFLERNKLASAVHSSMRTSTIEMSITRFVPLANRIGFPTRTGAEFPGPGPAVEAHCSGCDRPGHYARERLAERFGPDLRLPASYGRNKQGPAERTYISSPGGARNHGADQPLASTNNRYHSGTDCTIKNGTP